VSNVSIRDLRNHGGEVVERAQQGERVTITRAGRPVAHLTALPAPPLLLDELRERRRRLPVVDPDQLRSDIDNTIDASI